MDMQKTLKHDILSKYKHFKNLKLLKVTFLSFSLDQYVTSDLSQVTDKLYHNLTANTEHYVIKFVSDLRQVGGFLWVLRFPAPIKLKHFKNLKLLKVTFLSFSLDQYTNGMILY
jgi:hypothetical protein